MKDGITKLILDQEEIKRKFSISTSVVPVVWNDVKINFLDTPGYFDFVGETEVIEKVGGKNVFMESKYCSAPYFDIDIDGIILPAAQQ